MTDYKHGVYGEADASNYEGQESIGTLPVYIGSLPIQRINANGAADFDYAKYVNNPILISSYKDVKALGIYSDDWDTYTLCEAIRAHFMNSDTIMTPIVLINVLDPSKHVDSGATEATITVQKEGTSYVGYIKDALCSLDDIAITADGVQFSEGELTYAYDGDRVKIAIKKNGFAATSVTATYKKIKFAVSDIEATDFQKAVDAVDVIEQVAGLIPTILVAPAFSKVPANHDIMIQKAIEKPAGKWNMICVSDIPASADVNTIELAKAWKAENQYNSKHEKVCWPKTSSAGYDYHLSTITAFEMQATDAENEGIPYVSPSNKVIDANKVILDDGTSLFIKESEANELNAVGITTINFVKQKLRLWGSHMANYNHASLGDVLPEERFDLQIRMMGFILNFLQYNYISEIDESFTRKDVDSLVNSVQTWLDSLVNAGALLYAEVKFDANENEVEELENGDTLFDIKVTYPVSMKSITFRLQYTREGLNLLLEEEGDE